MGVPDTELRDGAPSRRPDLALAVTDEHATADTLTAAVEGRCVNCDAPLAPDQRYCVQCGQRRGRSRFALASGAESRPAAASSPRSEPARGRGSSGTTVVAGIATLVLALGVGVEIGRISNRSTPTPAASAQRPQFNIYNGGGASAGQSTPSGSSTPSAAGGRSSSKHSGASHGTHGRQSQAAASSTTPKPTSSAVKKASSAASSVLGGGSGQSNATVTTGQSCSAGSAGCQNGHFSGNYFGGG